LELHAQDPAAFLQSFAQDATALAEHHGTHFELEQGGPGQVSFEAKWMRQVLLNLLVNAIRVSPPGGRTVLPSSFDDLGWRLCTATAKRRDLFWISLRRPSAACRSPLRECEMPPRACRSGCRARSPRSRRASARKRARQESAWRPIRAALRRARAPPPSGRR